MSHAVLALAAAVFCAAGCVWSLPAVADVRAREDRPRSRRIAAAGCLTGWGTVALLVPLLLAPASWTGIGAVAVAGAATATALAARSRVQRAHELREAEEHWVAWGYGVPVRPAPAPSRAFLIWLLPGLVVATAVATAILWSGQADLGRTAAAALTAAGIVSVFLAIALVDPAGGHAARRGEAPRGRPGRR
ncbi:hypothetical protein [Streptomyces sp. 8ZJF_21]|uniref:hypothetical protein n=1 Tax=Streptomyces sp. 8ZJF_21 TaxID=2903141 RepID=UPI001E2F6D81|nr:hypothetical protein [Streptomyces sp. 8ZJF_21]MCD9586872.1 hypothetical protein [Streptomyces sp. 8ZJF_21]